LHEHTHGHLLLRRIHLHAGELINVLREAKQKVPEELLAFGTTVKKKEHSLYGAHFKAIDIQKKATKIVFD
jgi:ATP-dependent RNA helicase DBP3